MKTRLILIAAAALVLLGCKQSEPVPTTASNASAKAASAKPDFHKLVADGALLLDVRTPGEFRGGHIAGAKNIPVQELSARMAEVGPKDKDIVVYCHSGARASRAKAMLERAGFKKVHNLGPMSAW